MTIPTKRNYDWTARQSLPNTQPSMTVPDQSMSVREIISRYARGLPLMGNQNKLTHTGEDFEPTGFEHMDLADREDLIIAKREQLAQAERKIADAKAKKQKARAEKDKRSADAKATGLDANSLSAANNAMPDEDLKSEAGEQKK